MVSTWPPTSKSSRPFNNPLVTVQKAPITIGIIVTFMFHIFFSSLARSRYLSIFSHYFSFILWSAGTANSTILQIFFSFFFFVDYYKVWSSGRDQVIRLYIKVSQEFVCVLFKYRLCIYHFLAQSNLYFLHISQWITQPTHSCIALYSFCASLLYSLSLYELLAPTFADNLSLESE